MMVKLVILIEPQEDWQKFEQDWPQFLALAEKMPSLVKEATSPIQSRLHGNVPVSMMHELFFESMDDLKEAMTSPEGVAAGQKLQEITGGKVTLLFADHYEDELKNIRTFKKPKEDGPSIDRA
jgi:uncharacterized protein (TIGR02118 family)